MVDRSGAVIPNAKVVLKNEATNEERNTKSDATGFYAFPSVVPGTYDVFVEHSGFKRAEVKGRVAEVTQAAQAIGAGQLNQTVPVFGPDEVGQLADLDPGVRRRHAERDPQQGARARADANREPFRAHGLSLARTGRGR